MASTSKLARGSHDRKIAQAMEALATAVMYSDMVPLVKMIGIFVAMHFQHDEFRSGSVHPSSRTSWFLASEPKL